MTLSDSERDQQMFMALVMMLSENAMIGLGKIVPPGAEETTVQLPVAQAMIDMLDVLKRRTEGNLEDREAKLLEAQLTNLRLNFLEVKKDLDGKGEGSGDGDEDGDEGEGAADSADEGGGE